MRKIKKKAIKAAFLIEAAAGIMINSMLLMGGLEFGWHFYCRRALVEATGIIGGHPGLKYYEEEALFKASLTGKGFSKTFVDSVTKNTSRYNRYIQGKRYEIFTTYTSIPLDKTLLFSGRFFKSRNNISDGKLTIEYTRIVNQLSF